MAYAALIALVLALSQVWDAVKAHSGWGDVTATLVAVGFASACLAAGYGFDAWRGRRGSPANLERGVGDA